MNKLCQIFERYLTKCVISWHISYLGFSINTNRLPSDNAQERKIRFKIDPLRNIKLRQWKRTPLFNIYSLKHSLRNTFVQLHWYSIRMKSNEDNKTLISNILVRNIFLCLKQVYCCLTFVCVYIFIFNLDTANMSSESGTYQLGTKM